MDNLARSVKDGLLARSVKDGQRTLRNSLAGLGGPEDLYQYPSNINRGAAGATFTTPGRPLFYYFLWVISAIALVTLFPPFCGLI